MIALDVRELIRRHVFDQPAGSAFRLNLAYPWLRVMRLNSSSLDLQLVTGRSVIVPLVWASCGVMGEVASESARSIILSQSSPVVGAMVSGMRHSAPAAPRESF